MTVILTKNFQVSFKLWTTCVRQTHLSRPLPFHCASYSIWRCHVLIGVRNCDFEVFSPQFSWFGYDYSPLLMKISPQPLQILLFNSLSKLHYKRKGHFSFWTVFSNLQVLPCCRHLFKYFSKEFGHFLNWISDSSHQGNWERRSVLERRRKYLNCVFPSRARSICYTKLTRDIQPQNFSRSLDGPLAANSRLATRPSVKLKAKRFKVLNITIAK